MSSCLSKIIVALDYDNPDSALQLADQLDPRHCRLKVGKELFTRAGPDLVRKLVAQKFDVFLDLKFHDIPSTVAKAVAAAHDLGVWMTNVHASGGSRMMRAASDTLKAKDSKMLLIGVTVLTSMDESDLVEIGVTESASQQVGKLAKLAQRSGLDGVVCSAKEAAMLKQTFGANFKLITPGIRLVGSVTDDQKRVVTPPDAIALGSDYLVIGRPITQSLNPMVTLQEINDSIAN
jgi:orotidine-5'-phosphate decarboxylase